MSAYPRLNGPKTEEWIRILAIHRYGPAQTHAVRRQCSTRSPPHAAAAAAASRLGDFPTEVGEEPRGSPAEGHGLAVEEGRGRATRLLAHPAALFSSRSGASAEGAAGRKTEESAPAAMAELAIFLRTSLALPAE